MIKINVLKTKHGYKKIVSKGHADAAKHGEDIVCAAVSTLLFTLANTLSDFENLDSKDFCVDIDDGYMCINIKEECLSNDLNIVFKTIIIGLSGVAEEYPDYVKLHLEEVRS